MDAEQNPAASFLANTDAESIRARFNYLTEESSALFKSYAETIKKLHDVVQRCRYADIQDISLEYATPQKLRELKMTSGKLNLPCYLLGIYDARYLVRLQDTEENIVDLHVQNIHTARNDIIQLDQPAFWGNPGDKEQKYISYDLDRESDVAAFIDTILQTVATYSAQQNMSKDDIVIRTNYISKPGF